MVLFARTAVIVAITITVIIVWRINQNYKTFSFFSACFSTDEVLIV